MRLDRKDVPRWMIAAFPNYKGKTFAVEVTEKVELCDDSWEGGSKTTYMGVNMVTYQAAPQPKEYGNPFTNPQGGVPTVSLLPNMAIVAHSIFCGKDMGLKAYIHPDNMTKLLPQTPELSEDEKVVLQSTRANKASYGGVKNFRFSEANRICGITLDRWNTSKETLIQKGMLNKIGAITIQGRNAIA
jgi:hypothetical protein